MCDCTECVSQNWTCNQSYEQVCSSTEGGIRVDSKKSKRYKCDKNEPFMNTETAEFSDCQYLCKCNATLCAFLFLSFFLFFWWLLLLVLLVLLVCLARYFSLFGSRRHIHVLGPVLCQFIYMLHTTILSLNGFSCTWVCDTGVRTFTFLCSFLTIVMLLLLYYALAVDVVGWYGHCFCSNT